MMEYYLKCSWCKELTSTGRFIKVTQEMSANPSPMMFENLPQNILWCCTACYTIHLKDYVEETSDAPRHLNG